MTGRSPHRLALACLACATAAALGAAPASAARRAPAVTVMTQNLYLGANLLPLAAAGPGAPFEQAVGGVFAAVQASDPNARMVLVAREIARAKPDLVGLQESSVWSIGPRGDPAPARNVVFDYLGRLRSELRRLRAPYRVAAKNLSLNLEGSTDRTDVRFNDGEVVLARRGVRVTRVRNGDFPTQLRITTQALGAVEVTRGYNVVDAIVRGRRIRLVNAHLEAYSPAIRLAQARELVRAVRSRRATILLGDLNSGPRLPKPEDRPPYLAIAKAGYREARTRRFTCCFNDDLMSGRWDHNVDHILVRGSLRLLRSFATGPRKTPSGRYFSDHGGVVSVLRLPRQ